MIYGGIDPGLDGACAWLDAEGHVLGVVDTPTLVVESRQARHREYDVRSMARELGRYREAVVALERVHAMPGQGARSMWTMGFGSGVWTGILSALGLRYELVTPQRWQRTMLDGTGRGKDAARVKAMELFPAASADLRRKRDSGRADALLIAEWCRRSVSSHH